MMDTDWELEGWLLDAGVQVEERAATGSELTPIENLIREFWAFDIQTRNGGVSQYFGNHGMDRWQVLKSAWLPDDVPSLGPILSEVDRVLRDAADPYEATLDAAPGIERFYEAHQAAVCRELRRLSEAYTKRHSG